MNSKNLFLIFTIIVCLFMGYLLGSAKIIEKVPLSQIQDWLNSTIIQLEHLWGKISTINLNYSQFSWMKLPAIFLCGILTSALFTKSWVESILKGHKEGIHNIVKVEIARELRNLSPQDLSYLTKAIRQRNDDISPSTSSSPISDQRVKKDFHPLSGSLEKILALKGLRFSWKKEEFPNVDFEIPTIGFLAQEVEKILPELVTKGTDGLMRVHYAQFSALLVEAVKEQSRQITSLKRRLDEIEYQTANS